MKKLQKLLLFAIFSIGICGTVNAQVTHDAEQDPVVVGGNFTYTVPEDPNHNWTWEVLDNLGADADTDDYALIDVTPAVGYSKNITWKTAGTFYVRVTAEHKTTLCTNDFVIKVDVANNDYVVAFNAGTENVYCADDANIASGMEITLDVTLGGTAPATSYYGMEVQYKVGTNDYTATIGTDNKFTIPGMDVVNPVTPAFTSVTVTIVQIKDANGVIFTPDADADKLVITVHPIPAKPTITIL
ncbi:hypothetical protein DF185_20570 [Marinifilum breve]|uniref:PKD domain-containing protein n=1 Tax=Marinifilum breve TaxID=2184082 RepID=A0A2V3ZSA2_9BACT|nr:hypothetical protein [Marinifilum breve]PXX96176.1 hypothetical protein DF185_20570 [Marinifilum breve]